MTSTILFVYLGSVVNAFTAFCVVFATLLFLASIGLYIGSCAYEHYKQEQVDKMRAEFRKFAKYSVIIALVLSFIGIVLPDKKVCYMMAAITSADYIAHETNVGKAINETSVTLIKDVGKIIHELANPSNEKINME